MPALPSPDRAWWRIPLVRELAVILLLKLALLLGIRAYWFDQPVVPVDGTERVAERLLSRVPAESPVSHEEQPQ
ncbi:cytochrome oxidase putative small subunit CydP [Atopomonas sediminilitoris]|uniref:cytochrome oxidase putative small subunit CydP n=1 Tax=Atopomonas sediminilitoris TaxID=2919919 RepID=UPI001F4D51CA|nr:cytochrome oxidase putative small subunit CydP [Atopomonas sediminilitoris]MCJ8169490.1 hypothetical protein [Atopomonas sediminilitoris]